MEDYDNFELSNSESYYDGHSDEAFQKQFLQPHPGESLQLSKQRHSDYVTSVMRILLDQR